MGGEFIAIEVTKGSVHPWQAPRGWNFEKSPGINQVLYRRIAIAQSLFVEPKLLELLNG